MIAASGGCSAATSSASFAVDGRHRLEPGVAQHDPQRAQDLRLVVADEHAAARRAHATGAGHRRRRELDDEGRPLAGERLDRDGPAVGLDEPARDGEAEPGAPVAGALGPRRGRTARRRARAARRGCRARGPRPGRRRAHRPPAHGPRRRARRSGGRRSPAGWRTRARAARRRPAAAAASPWMETENVSAGSARPSIAASSTSSSVHHSGRGSAACASSRDRSSRFSMSRDRRWASSWIPRASSRRSPSSTCAVVRRVRRREDRGDGRAQIVAHGAQQRRLDDVAAPQRTGLHDVAQQLVALQRGAQQRLQ